jgi:hypothetical protein
VLSAVPISFTLVRRGRSQTYTLSACLLGGFGRAPRVRRCEKTECHYFAAVEAKPTLYALGRSSVTLVPETERRASLLRVSARFEAPDRGCDAQRNIGFQIPQTLAPCMSPDIGNVPDGRAIRQLARVRRHRSSGARNHCWRPKMCRMLLQRWKKKENFRVRAQATSPSKLCTVKYAAGPAAAAIRQATSSNALTQRR